MRTTIMKIHGTILKTKQRDQQYFKDARIYSIKLKTLLQ
jgi:hypothetical protein